MRKGILSIGTTVVDSVKIIDDLPQKNCVALVHEISRHVGGNVPNVLIDLAIMDPTLPLFGGGVIGNDGEGDFVEKELKKYNIDTQYMFRSSIKTSASDIMTLSTTGERTVFYFKGASAQLTLDQVKKVKTNARIAQVAYLGTLDELEQKSEPYGSKVAEALKYFQDEGCKTCVDVVSVNIHEELKRTIFSCLPYTDYFIVNEIETAALLNIETRDKNGKIILKALETSVKEFIKQGVGSCAVIHCPEVAVCCDKEGNYVEQKSFFIENSEIKGTVGAGDAFLAAFLYSMHEGINIQDALKYGHASARFNLQSPGAVDGAVSFEKIKALVNQFA